MFRKKRVIETIGEITDTAIIEEMGGNNRIPIKSTSCLSLSLSLSQFSSGRHRHRYFTHKETNTKKTQTCVVHTHIK